MELRPIANTTTLKLILQPFALCDEVDFNFRNQGYGLTNIQIMKKIIYSLFVLLLFGGTGWGQSISKPASFDYELCVNSTNTSNNSAVWGEGGCPGTSTANWSAVNVDNEVLLVENKEFEFSASPLEVNSIFYSINSELTTGAGGGGRNFLQINPNSQFFLDENSSLTLGSQIRLLILGEFVADGDVFVQSSANNNGIFIEEGGQLSVFGTFNASGNNTLITFNGSLNGTGTFTFDNNSAAGLIANAQTATINDLDWCEAMDILCASNDPGNSDCGCDNNDEMGDWPPAPWNLSLIGTPEIRWDGFQWITDEDPEDFKPNYNIIIDGPYETGNVSLVGNEIASNTVNGVINNLIVTSRAGNELILSEPTSTRSNTIKVNGDIYNEGKIVIEDRQILAAGLDSDLDGNLYNVGEVYIEDHGSFVINDVLTLTREGVAPDPANPDPFIQLERHFPNQPGWKFFSFPASSTSTLSLDDFVLTGPGNQFGLTDWEFVLTSPLPQRVNVYFWNEEAATWDFINSSNNTRKNLHGNAFLIYAPNGPDVEMVLTMENSDFNVDNSSFERLTYFDGTGEPQAVPFSWAFSNRLDGWVMVPNPWQASISVSQLRASLSSTHFQSLGTYVYDGSQYQVSNGQTGDFDFIAPNKAIFLQRENTTLSALPFDEEWRSRSSTEGIAVRSAQRNLKLNLSGANQSVNTYISENHLAQDVFDKEFDMLYHRGVDAVPVFNSVTDDSLAVAINTVNDFVGKQIYLTFSHKDAGEQFTISLDGTELPMGMQVELTDLYLNQTVELTEHDYNFISVANAPAQRFLLSFYGSAVSTAKNAADDRFAKTWFINDELRVEKPGFEGKADVTVTDMNGRVLSHSVMNGSSHETTVRGAAGVYIVTINHGGKAYRSKVVKY